MIAALRLARIFGVALMMLGALGDASVAASTLERSEPGGASNEAHWRIVPSPLLSIDQNRATVMERIVSEWGDTLLRSNAGVDAAQLRSMLDGMRADHLLAASLAGTLDGLRNALSIAITSDAAVKSSLLQAKALGDAGGDLVYTPITPCRIVDTVSVGGAIPALTTRSFRGTTATNFTPQGGNATNCAIPVNAAGLQTTVTVVSPTQAGYLLVYPFNAPQPTAFTMIYQPNLIASTAATVLLTKGQANEFTAFLEKTAFLQVDVVGYFKAPGGGYVASVTAGTGLSGGTITGSGTLAVDTAVIQARVAGTCAAGSSIRAINVNGTVTCETDDTGGGGGTVTSVGTGSGLTGGPITTTGTVAADTTYLQRRVSSTCAVGSSIRAIAADGTVTCQTDGTGPADAFVQGGNSFGATAVLGTADAHAVDIRVGGVRAMRFEPASGAPNVIGGFQGNNVTTGSSGAAIGGGGLINEPNVARGSVATIGGGAGNSADEGAFVGGGYQNTAKYLGAVGGGQSNTASGIVSLVGGGIGNVASGDFSVVGGGQYAKAGGEYSTVAGGIGSQAPGQASFAVGWYNNAGGDRSVAMGYNSMAAGRYSVAMGYYNYAAGDYSVALGSDALTTASAVGSFVFADSTGGQFGSGVPNEFLVAASGGIGMFTNRTYSAGCKLNPGGGQWSCFSSRDAKSDFEAIDPIEILDRVAALPMTTWRYLGEATNVRHLGPMAQDFHAAFGLGTDDQTIGVLDGSGVALAAVQGLNDKLELQLRQRDVVITAMQAQIAELAGLVSQRRATPSSARKP